MRFLSWLLKIFLVLVFILCIGMFIFFLTFDLNRYKPLIEQRASEELGRTVHIDSLSLKLSFVPTVGVKGLVIENPEGFEAKEPLLRVEDAEVTLALTPLLTGTVDLRDFSLGPVFVFLAQREGQNNWTFDVSSKDEKQASSSQGKEKKNNLLSRLNVDNVTAKQLRVLYHTEGAEQQIFAVTDFSMKQLRVFSGHFFYQTYAAEISGVVNNLTDLILQKPDYLFNLTVNAFDASFKITGNIGDVKNFKNMAVEIKGSGAGLVQTLKKIGIQQTVLPAASKVPFSFETAIKGDLSQFQAPKFFAAFGKDVSVEGKFNSKREKDGFAFSTSGSLEGKDGTLLKALRLKPFSLSFDVDGDGARVLLKKADIVAGKSDVSIAGMIDFKQEKPFVTLKAVSEYFDLNDVLPQDEETAHIPATQTASASQEKQIDLSALKAFNATVSAVINRFKVPSDFGGYVVVQADAVLKNAVLTVSPVRLELLGGEANATATMDATAQPVKLSLKASAQGLRTDSLKFLRDFVSGSTVNVDTSLTATGQSLKAWSASLSGEVSMEVSNGTIVNKWFNTLPRTIGAFKTKQNQFSYSEADAVNELLCGALNLSFKNGVAAVNQNIALETSLINFVLSGQIDLAKQTLSLSMTPSLNAASADTNYALTVMQGIRISGPFDNLKPELSASDVVQSAASGLVGKALNQLSGTPTRIEPYALCRRALGRKLTTETRTPVAVTSSSQPTQPAPVVEESEEVSPGEAFKRSLMDSLTQALQKK